MGIIFEEFSACNDIVNSDESINKIKKDKEYLDYINKHVLGVQKAYNDYFLPLLDKNHISDLISDEELKDAIKKAAIYVSIHDASKYDDFEFNMYRVKHYPTNYELSDLDYMEQAEKRYQEAWKSHYKHNWHHPKYWVDDETGKIKDMQLEAIIEMICDWISVGNRIGNETREWYKNDAKDEKDAMSDKTKQIVEEILYKIIYK